MRGRAVHYQFEENKQLPKDVIEVLVKSCQFDNSVQKSSGLSCPILANRSGSFADKNGRLY